MGDHSNFTRQKIESRNFAVKYVFFFLKITLGKLRREKKKIDNFPKNPMWSQCCVGHFHFLFLFYSNSGYIHDQNIYETPRKVRNSLFLITASHPNICFK